MKITSLIADPTLNPSFGHPRPMNYIVAMCLHRTMTDPKADPVARQCARVIYYTALGL
jgi:hypothetical protein